MISTRTRKTMIARTQWGDVEYKTAGDYTVAGVVLSLSADDNFAPEVVAVGTSWDSVSRRTKTISRKRRPGIHAGDHRQVMEVVALDEATAPVVREYFSRHDVPITQVYRPGTAWTQERYLPGRSIIRKLAAEGVTAVAFSLPLGRGRGLRTADFQMTELLNSMNARKKVQA